MAKVYICTSVRGMNVFPAQEFSDTIPKFIYEGPSINFNVVDVIENIRHNLSDVKPGDYLVLCGDPVLMALCSIEFFDMTEGNFNFLKWDKRSNKYYPILIDYAFEEEDGK